MESMTFEQLLETSIQAMITCLSPNSIKSNRNAAENFLSSLKSYKGIEICLYLLNHRNSINYSIDIQLLSCSILSDSIKQRYNQLNLEQSIELRNSLFHLFLNDSNNIDGSSTSIGNDSTMSIEDKSRIKSNSMLSNKVIRIKLAVISSFIVERQYPKIWSTFIEDMIQIWQSYGIESQIVIIMILDTVLEDCIDTDFNSILTTTQRRDILSGIKTNAMVLFSTACQYFSYCYNSYSQIVSEGNARNSSIPINVTVNTEEQNRQVSLFEDAMNQLLRMLCPLVSHIKPLTNSNLYLNASSNNLNENTGYVSSDEQLSEWNKINDTIICMATVGTTKPILLQQSIALLFTITSSEKLDIESILVIMKYILTYNKQSMETIYSCYGENDLSNHIFYQNQYILTIYKLISNNIRELYQDTNRIKTILNENQSIVIGYFQFMIECIRLPIVSYRLISELINEWVKIIKDYPTLSNSISSVSSTQPISPNNHRKVEYHPFPWLEELIPILLEFYYQKCCPIVWDDNSTNNNSNNKDKKRLFELLEIEFDESAEFKEFYGTFKSQVRGLYQTISMKFPMKSIEGVHSLVTNLIQLTESIIQNNITMNSINNDDIVNNWNGLPSLLDCVFIEVLSPFLSNTYHSIIASTTVHTISSNVMQSSNVSFELQNILLISIKILESIRLNLSSEQNPYLVVPKLKSLQSCAYVLKAYYRLMLYHSNNSNSSMKQMTSTISVSTSAASAAAPTPAPLSHPLYDIQFHPMKCLLQVFQIYFQYYKLINLSYESIAITYQKNPKLGLDLLISIIGTNAIAISFLCEQCYELILHSINSIPLHQPSVIPSHTNSSNNVNMEHFPLAEFITYICDILSPNNITLSNSILHNTIQSDLVISIPIYAKTSLRDSLVVLSDSISTQNMMIENMNYKNQLLSIALGSVIQSWTSYTVTVTTSSPSLSNQDRDILLSFTPEKVFSSSDSLLQICRRSISHEIIPNTIDYSAAYDDLLQESIGILRYLISAAKRVAIPQFFDNLFLSQKNMMTSSTQLTLYCSKIREFYPYIDVWIASMPIIIHVSITLHQIYHPIYRHKLSSSFIESSSNNNNIINNSINTYDMIYIPSVMEILDAIGPIGSNSTTVNNGSNTSHSTMNTTNTSFNDKTYVKRLWYIRYQLHTVRQYLYSLVEKAIHHGIFWIEDILSDNLSYSLSNMIAQNNNINQNHKVIQEMISIIQNKKGLDNLLRLYIYDWIQYMENDQIILFLKTIFDNYVVNLIPTKYLTIGIEVIYTVIKHMNQRLTIAYSLISDTMLNKTMIWNAMLTNPTLSNTMQSSNLNESDVYFYYLYRENNIPMDFSYQTIGLSHAPFNSSGSSNLDSMLSKDNIDLAKSNMIANLSKQYADSISIISGCKGILSKMLPTNPITPSNTTQNTTDQISITQNSAVSDIDFNGMNISSTSTTSLDETKSARRNNIRELILYTNIDILNEFLSSLSILMKLTIVETCKKSMIVITDILLERCLCEDYLQNSIKINYDHRILSFLSTDIFSIGIYILLRNASWSVGLEWDIIALLTQIYWTIRLGQRLDTDFNQSSNSNAVPRTILQNNPLSDSPRQILLSLPYVSMEWVQSFELNLLQSLHKKHRRELFRDLIVTIIQSNKSNNSSNPGNPSNSLVSADISITGSILESKKSCDNYSSINSNNNSNVVSMDSMSDSTKRCSSSKSANIVELGDCDLSKIFK